jgi:hypothetical protein
MRERDRGHLRELVRMLGTLDGPLSRSDTVALLILLRERAGEKSMLQDLGHSVAHDARDKGRSFDYLEKFSLNVRRVLIHGGNLRVPVMFPVRRIIGEINGVMAQLDAPERLPLADVRLHYSAANSIAEALDGTTYSLKVANSELACFADGSGYPAFQAMILFKHEIETAIPIRTDKLAGFSVPWLMSAEDIRTGLDALIARQSKRSRAASRRAES